jgi:ATP-dependent DNA helicase RecG
LIKEIGDLLVRKRFDDIPQLKSLVYDSLITFLSKKGKITIPDFDSSVNPEATYEDINESLVENFLNTRAIKLKVAAHPIPVLDFLLKTLNVIEKINGEYKPNNTALLFFCDQPQDRISQSSIKIARYKGITRLQTLDSRGIKGDLYTILEDVISFVKKNTRLAGKVVGFKRIDIPEYPYEAIREAVINAMAHRDYNQITANIQIEIFDDRIEVTSPGGLLSGLNIKKLAGVHKSRNRKICQIFHETRDMERFGTGVNRMNDLMRQHGLRPPDLSEEGDFFRATFYGPGEHILDLASNIPEEMQVDLSKMGLNRRQIEALRMMVNERRPMTNRNYRKLFKVGNKTAAEDLKELVRKKIAISRGRGRSVSYISK